MMENITNIVICKIIKIRTTMLFMKKSSRKDHLDDTFLEFLHFDFFARNISVKTKMRLRLREKRNKGTASVFFLYSRETDS